MQVRSYAMRFAGIELSCCILKRPIVVVSAKTTSDAFSSSTHFPPNPNSSQSTISTVEREIKEDGGEATAVAVDARDFASVEELVRKTIEVDPPSLLPLIHPGITRRIQANF